MTKEEFNRKWSLVGFRAIISEDNKDLQIVFMLPGRIDAKTFAEISKDFLSIKETK